jgi:hypothetical protein
MQFFIHGWFAAHSIGLLVTLVEAVKKRSRLRKMLSYQFNACKLFYVIKLYGVFGVA